VEWLTGIRAAIEFIEDNLEEDISVQDVAGKVFISPIFLQRGFSFMTGYNVGEYIRNRRLYQAAIDLRSTEDPVIDIAYRYCYETPESFTKAFSRFHGATPSQVRAGAPFNQFLPVKINITVQGGDKMDYKVTPKDGLKVIGFQKIFDSETSYAEIPKFWSEVVEKYASNIYAGNEPANEYEKAVRDNRIGEFGICIDDIGGTKFRYLIAGRYTGGAVPLGMEIYEIPDGDWAVFHVTGPCPGALQSVNTKIFTEWLPGNPDYEISGNANVEWYADGDPAAADYKSAIWIPVKKK
jgi:AraC family transcriptional regulator